VKGGNGASVWTKTGEDEELVDSTHGAAAGWEQVHGARTVGSGPKGKMPDREAIATGDHRQSLGPLWKGDEWCRESSDGPGRAGVKRPWREHSLAQICGCGSRRVWFYRNRVEFF
jgi:hypothetical protein